jgi:hypothetical protein
MSGGCCCSRAAVLLRRRGPKSAGCCRDVCGAVQKADVGGVLQTCNVQR